MRFDLRVGNARVLVRDLEPEDEEGVLEVFAASEDWFSAESGQPSAPGDVQSSFYAIPEGNTFDDKVLLVIDADGAIVGFIDAVLRYPREASIGVGAFLIRPEFRRRGIGGAVVRVLLAAAAEAGYAQISSHVPPGWEVGYNFLAAADFTFAEPRAPRGNTNRNPGPYTGPVIPALITLRGKPS